MAGGTRLEQDNGCNSVKLSKYTYKAPVVEQLSAKAVTETN